MSLSPSHSPSCCTKMSALCSITKMPPRPNDAATDCATVVEVGCAKMQNMFAKRSGSDMPWYSCVISLSVDAKNTKDS